MEVRNLFKKFKTSPVKLHINVKLFITVAIIIILTIASSSTVLFSKEVEAVIAAASMSTASNVTKNKPVEGYDSPQGYFTVIKHIYNDPNLRVSVFCKPSVKVLIACQIYDTSLSYPRLIGIQYAITPKDYNSLPPEEKPNWYILDKNLLTQTQPQFPELNAQQINMVLPHLLGNYAKLIITWNPLDNLPISANNHLRTENLQYLFVVKSTNTNNSSTIKK